MTRGRGRINITSQVKKDILIALSVGVFVGAVAALVFINLPNILNKTIKPLNTLPSTNGLTTNNQITKPDELTIESPADNLVSDSKNLNVEGKTTINNVVLIETDFDNKISIASGGGSFKFPVTLSEGVNKIYVTSYNNSGEGITKSLNVFYTSEKI